MKKTIIISTMAAGCLALAVALVLAPKLQAASSGSSKTAQSIMVSLIPSSNAFEVGGDVTWTYTHPVKSCAADHYITVETGPVITCTGNCGGPTPTPPPPPGDTPGHLNSFLNSSEAVKCGFFCGGDLPSDANPRTVDVNLPGNVHWHFTWTYTLTPTGSVDPQTCYECTQTGGGPVDIAFCGFVAGESFLLKSGGNTTWTKKYSFTLTEPDPISGLPVSRVTNVQATLQRSTDGGTTWFDVQGPVNLDTTTIVHCGKPTDLTTFCDGLGPVVDYTYDANAGVGGNSTVFNYLHSSGSGNMPPGTYMLPDTTGNIMNGVPPSQDNFAGNNNDLCDYSDTAPIYVDFPGITDAGDYRIHVTGTVKGNSAVADQQFDVTGTGGTVTVNGCNSPDCTIPASCPE